MKDARRQGGFGFSYGSLISFLDQKGRRVEGRVVGETERNGIQCMRVTVAGIVALVTMYQRPRLHEKVKR